LKEKLRMGIFAHVRKVLSGSGIVIHPIEALICLGAGPSQVPIIEAAQKLGFAIIAIDKDRKAPGLSLAEVGIPNSTHDSQGCLKSVIEIDNTFKIVGVLNRSSGPPVVTAAVLNEALGFNGVPISSAQICVNKHLLREKFGGLGDNAPRYVSLPGYEGLNLPFDYPVIVKPSLSIIGKSGINKVPVEEGLPTAIAKAREVSVNGIVLIEEFIVGEDVSMIGFVQGGELIVISLMDEINSISESGLIEGRGFAIPSRYSETEVEKKISTLAYSISQSLMITDSPFMLSFRIYKNQIPKLIEIHLDLGGDMLIEQLYPYCLGVNILHIAVWLSACQPVKNLDLTIKPGALIYEPGNGLNRERNYKFLDGSTRLDLEKKIEECLGDEKDPVFGM
jgi:biotin carboxylase